MGSKDFNLYILHYMVSGEITLRFAESDLRLECGPNKACLRTSEETLPAIEAVQHGEAVSLTGKDLRRLAGIAQFASTDDARPVLQAVHLSFLKDEAGRSALQAQAADGFSFARLRLQVQLPAELEAQLAGPVSKTNRAVSLLPVAFVRMLAAVVQPDDQVLFRAYPKGGRASFHISSETRDYLLDSSLMGDGFPESGVEDVLAKALVVKGAEITLKPADVERVIRQVIAMGTRQMFLKNSKGVVLAASEDTQFGLARNVLAGMVAGPDAHVWLNADYLTRIIKAAAGDLILKIGKPQEPVLVQYSDLVALIMPLLCNSDPFKDETAIPISLEQAAPVAA
jgi:hypothetical protein